MDITTTTTATIPIDEGITLAGLRRAFDEVERTIDADGVDVLRIGLGGRSILIKWDLRGADEVSAPPDDNTFTPHVSERCCVTPHVDGVEVHTEPASLGGHLGAVRERVRDAAEAAGVPLEFVGGVPRFTEPEPREQMREALTKCALAIAFSYGGTPLTGDMPAEDRAMIEAMRAAHDALGNRSPTAPEPAGSFCGWPQFASPESCDCCGSSDPDRGGVKAPEPVSFRVDSVSELIGQLVGLCSSTRFWDRIPTDYPSGAGVFQEDVAGRLVDATMAEYRRLTDSGMAPDVGMIADVPPEPKRCRCFVIPIEASPAGHEDCTRNDDGSVRAACRDAVMRREPDLIDLGPGQFVTDREPGWQNLHVTVVGDALSVDLGRNR